MNHAPGVDPLSDDILLHIYGLFAQRTFTSFLQVLAISHTSRRWRALAIDCPELWRPYALMQRPHQEDRPSTNHEEVDDFRQEMIRRCRGLTLDAGWRVAERKCLAQFRFPADLPPRPKLIKALRGSTQFRSLTLFLDHFRFKASEPFLQLTEASTRALEQCAAHTLEELIIDCSNRGGRRTAPLPLPNGMFKGDLPNLTSVRLMGAWIDFEESGIGRNLHNLVVQIDTSNEALPTSLHAWAYILRSLPVLKALAVRWSRFVWHRTQRIEEKYPAFDLTLPNLLELEMTLDICELKYLMAYISLPACRRLFITLKVREGGDVEQDVRALVERYALPYVSAHSEVTIFDSPNSPAFTIAFARSNSDRDPEVFRRSLPSSSSSLSSQDAAPVKASVYPWWKHNLVLVLDMEGDRHSTQISQFSAFTSAWMPLIAEVPTVVLSPETPYGGGRLSTRQQQQPPPMGAPGADSPYRHLICRLLTSGEDAEAVPMNLVCEREVMEEVKARCGLKEGEDGSWGSSLHPRRTLRFVSL